MEQTVAIVVAAGSGTRMGTRESKQYLLLNEKPILVHTLEAMQRWGWLDRVVVVTGTHDMERVQGYVAQYGLSKVADVVIGGKERQHSVKLGVLSAAAQGSAWILVHDGVRPFISEEAALRCMEAAKQDQAAVLAVPVIDTIKVVNEAGFIEATPDRKKLWAIQTPQAFRADLLLQAHLQAEQEGFIGTDDAMLVERLGVSVRIAEGEYSNVKITTPEDLQRAKHWLNDQGRGERTQ